MCTKNKDYYNELKIRHLLAHTSGLADYFQGKGNNGISLDDGLKKGNDRSWTFDDAMKSARSMCPHFIPGTKGKAYYSDTNFQLLGKIIETITSQSYLMNCDELIIKPLNLSNTYLYTDASDQTPKVLYYKSNVLPIYNAMASFGPDGSIVSTSADMLRFVESFFTGKLFPREYINDLQQWNKIFTPMKSGIGIHLFKLPWYFNPTGAVPAYIGHSGLSGALAFYSPQSNLFIAGTVNQVARPDLSFRTMIKLGQIAMKK